MPILGVGMLAGIISNYLQVGFLFSTEVIKPKLEKLDPIKGFKRIYSIRALVELLKSILKIGFVGFATFIALWMHFDEILRLPLLTAEETLHFVANMTLIMGLYAAGALLILAGLDYMYQKFDYEKTYGCLNKTSKMSIKSEGDLPIKSKIKQRQRKWP